MVQQDISGILYDMGEKRLHEPTLFLQRDFPVTKQRLPGTKPAVHRYRVPVAAIDVELNGIVSVVLAFNNGPVPLVPILAAV